MEQNQIPKSILPLKAKYTHPYGDIFTIGQRYVLVLSDGVMTTYSSNKLVDVLSHIYSNIVVVFFDKDGDLHVLYEDEDLGLLEDIWRKSKSIPYNIKIGGK